MSARRATADTWLVPDDGETDALAFIQEEPLDDQLFENESAAGWAGWRAMWWW